MMNEAALLLFQYSTICVDKLIVLELQDAYFATYNRI